MKLTHITAQNYLGAHAVDLAITTPVTLFAGKNGAGKSSLQEAIRHALGGDFARVALKKDFKALITDEADSAFTTVATDAGECSIVLPSGKGVHHDHPALPFVLDASRFARLAENERRQFLFGLFGLTPDGPAVTDALETRGCEPAKIEQIKPLLRAGFDAAAKEAQAKARDAKAVWKATTGGETWGKDKSAGWHAPRPADTYGKEQVKVAEGFVADTEAEIETVNQQIGEIRAASKQRLDAEARIATLKPKAARLPSLQEKLKVDEKELADWSAKLAELPAAGNRLPEVLGCPCCGAALMHGKDGELLAYDLPKDGPVDPEIETKRDQWSKAVAMYERSVANDKRDIAEAERAADDLKALEESLGTLPQAHSTIELEAKLADLRAERKARAESVASMYAANKQAADADELTRKAAKAHADVLAWVAIADALAPDGIPAEMLASALDPINERLTDFAGLAEWADVTVTRDMEILAGGRPYALLSESEKWRADAMIAAAIADLSGLRLLVLDRFDVLDGKGREDLIYWLDGMAADGVLDTALVFGTMKALPAGLPETISPVWIEGGVVGEMREAE